MGNGCSYQRQVDQVDIDLQEFVAEGVADYIQGRLHFDYRNCKAVAVAVEEDIDQAEHWSVVVLDYNQS